MVDLYARITGDILRLVRCLSVRFCNQMRSAGSLKEDVIDPLEGAYQLARGRIKVENVPSGWIGALEVVYRLVSDVDLFIVYYDLRRRGRRVKRGLRPRTLIVEYSRSRILEVLVLSEGRYTSLMEIADWSKSAARDEHLPVIAIVDDYGIVTYYEARASNTIS